MDDIIELAEGVSEEIGDGAEVMFAPEFDLKGIKEKRIVVVPAGIETKHNFSEGYGIKCTLFSGLEIKIHNVLLSFSTVSSLYRGYFFVFYFTFHALRVIAILFRLYAEEPFLCNSGQLSMPGIAICIIISACYCSGP